MSENAPATDCLSALGEKILEVFVGENWKNSQELEATPVRFANAIREMLSGYVVDPVRLVRTFDADNNLVGETIQKGIPLYSLCQHHILPFFGTVDIWYKPNSEKPVLIGLSKFSRVVDAFARRLQTQEILTEQIARALYEATDADVVGVRSCARHLCQEARGVRTAPYTFSTFVCGPRVDNENAVEFVRRFYSNAG